jgi:hypothetical protein
VKKVAFKRFLFVFVISIAVIGLLGTYFFYSKYQQSLQTPKAVQVKETDELLRKVSKHIILPSDTPTIATVTDVKKLKDQTFFAHAKDGDKVLIYTNERKAILYNPTLDRIVEVGPLNITSGTNTGTQTNTATAKTPLRLAIYNGTVASGSAKRFEAYVQSKINNVDIVVLKQAKKLTYTDTLVIDLTKENTDFVNKAADMLNGQVTSLPVGEIRPNADILIIMGKTLY